MFKETFYKCRNYIYRDSGVAAIIFALMLPMMMAAGGIAVDMSLAYNSQSRLSNALDKAVLAAASSNSLTTAQIQARFQAFFAANYPAGKYGTPYNVDLTINGNTMTASASATVPMTFMSMVGIKSLNVSAASQAQLTLAGVEAVLVLDTTGSMAGNNIAALKLASTNFINIMFSSITNTNYLKIGIVPWSETVNVGPYGIGKNPGGGMFETGTTFISWPGNPPYPNPDPYVTPSSSIVYTANPTGANQTEWGGCVMEPNSAAITQDDPSFMWPMFRYQHFSPKATSCQDYACLTYNCETFNCATYQCTSCPSGDTLSNGFCCQSGYSYSGGVCKKNGTTKSPVSCKTTSSSACAVYGSTCLVQGSSTNGASCKTPGSASNGAACTGWGTSTSADSDLPNNECTSVPVLPLTSDQNALLAEINALPTANSTYPDIGMVWGWRLISQNAPFTEGVATSDNTWSKTVIMMTDGNATVDTVMSGEGIYGITSGISQTPTNENDKFAQICSNMKAQGIRIYTITFQSAITQSTMDYYSDCATQPSMYFNAPTNADLTAAFQKIATQLSQLHLTQ